MLVRFDSSVGTFTMFGDVAVQLLKMMGHSGTVPSALLAAEIPGALVRLKSAVAAAPEPPDEPVDDDGKPEQPKVTLRQRAFPLIDLLERSAKAGADVLWDKG
jgi:hypothetical protein